MNNKLFSRNSLERLRKSCDIERVLYEFKVQQENFRKYECPFCFDGLRHMMASKASGQYLCLDCGAHGDSVDFLMYGGKMNFIQAVEWLSQFFECSLLETKDDPSTPEDKKALFLELLNSMPPEDRQEVKIECSLNEK